MTGRRETLPQGDEKVTAVRSMFDRIAPRYDMLNRIMTFGLDVRWRRRSIDVLGLPRGATVVDVACGTGDFCREMQRSGLNVVGMDFSMGMLVAAKADTPLVQADALRLPLGDGSVDGLTCGFALRNVASLASLFDEVARVVRPGGRIALLEVAEPEGRLTRFGHHVYFHRVVPLIGGLLSDKSAYNYLPRSTEYLPPPDDLLEMLRGRGFVGIERETLGLGAAQLISATRE